jgi:CubicO group peptidase (beta-lactamase class C family)
LYLKTKQGIIEQYGGKGTNSYTNFRMASVTKQFVAFSVLTLIESGAVNINTNLSQIFDDLPKYMKNITIRHLLTHTSGLVDYEDRPKIGRKQITDTKVFAYLKTLKRAYFKPGTKYRYSNGGYIILGQIIEKISGKNLPFFVHNAILSPAGMHNSVMYTEGVSVIKNRAYGHKRTGNNRIIVCDQGPNTATQGDGGLYSSIHDLKKYLCFIQHILYSLKDNGKAAIVVPTGFITAQSGIEKTIRQRIIDRKWLKGVISMPSNIFANTGTNVSVLFIDKSNQSGEVLLMDASKMGTKVKVGKNQKTVLSEEELNTIVNTFNEHKVVEDFSVSVTYDQIKEKNYSFSAGQYFDVKIEYIELTQEEFEAKMKSYDETLDKLFAEGDELNKQIKEQLSRLKYKKNGD